MTAYMGKWHLDGKTKSNFDFGKKKRKFGYDNTDFQYNRGHWKYFNNTEDGLQAFEWKDRIKFTQNGANEEQYYATDFLFDRAIDFIDSATSNNNSKFAVMISIADPHDPNEVRPPYDKMFEDSTFRVPATARKAMHGDPSTPEWAALNDFDPEHASDKISEMINDPIRQKNMQQIFGMVSDLSIKHRYPFSFISFSLLRNLTVSK